MLLKIFYLFSLFFKFEVCESNDASEYYIDKIRDDYCLDYCANQCERNNLNRNIKNCNNTGNRVITDRYEIELDDNKITLTWKTNSIDLKHLQSLNLSNNRSKVNKFNIMFDESVTEYKFVPSIRYMEAFNLFKVDEIQTNYYYEYGVFASGGPQRANLKCPKGIENPSSIWHNYLSECADYLKEIYFYCGGTFALRESMFQNCTQLKTISFYSLNLVNLNEMTFGNVTNIKVLKFDGCNFDNLSFLRSPVLQNNLEELRLFNVRVHLTNLQNYRNLKAILVNDIDKSYYSQEISRINHTAFICDSLFECDFNVGINGRRCPSKCKCTFYYFSEFFIIDCRQQGLPIIPELPIPITGETFLYVDGNGLTSLPNTSSAGYNNLRRLHLANNKLKKLTIDQLPQNITHLDIRNNSITSLDPKVIEYLTERKDEISLLQTGIYWKCNCNNKDLLNYLNILRMRKTITIQYYQLGPDFGYRFYENIQVENPVYYHHLQGPCPENCTCCSTGPKDTQFMINCRNKALRKFPILPDNIIGDSSLLLDNNLIETLPDSPMRNSTLREIHLKNNSLRHLHLHQLPSNIRVLDIRQNKLAALDDNVTQFISRIRDIQFSGNPWQCDCKFIKFLEYLRRDHPMEYKAALRNCSGQEECPEQCTCCKDDDLRFIVNCTGKRLTKIPPIPITPNASLLFNHNRLVSLDRSVAGFDQLKELHLEDNYIREIDYIPSNLQLLDIRNNSLWKLSGNLTEYFSQKMNQSKLNLYLSGNYWICNCSEINFFRFTKFFAENIPDLCSIQCSSGTLFVSLEEKDVCPPKIPSYVLIFTSFILFTILLSFLQCFWNYIKMWLYVKRFYLRLTARIEVDTGTKYDCFLAYCHKDSHLVKEYVDRLERGRNRLRLCFYERDWLVGEPIPDCICHSVENSRCTAILMTNNFLKSVWGRLEFRLALHATSKDPNKRLIVIVYPEVENFDKLDSELHSYMKLNTYLMRSDPNFWTKLIYVLPHKPFDKNQEMEII